MSKTQAEYEQLDGADKSVVVKKEEYILWLKTEIEKLEKHIFEKVFSRYDVADAKALALLEKELSTQRKKLEIKDSMSKVAATETEVKIKKLESYVKMVKVILEENKNFNLKISS